MVKVGLLLGLSGSSELLLLLGIIRLEDLLLLHELILGILL